MFLKLTCTTQFIELIFRNNVIVCRSGYILMECSIGMNFRWNANRNSLHNKTLKFLIFFQQPMKSSSVYIFILNQLAANYFAMKYSRVSRKLPSYGSQLFDFRDCKKSGWPTPIQAQSGVSTLTRPLSIGTLCTDMLRAMLICRNVC